MAAKTNGVSKENEKTPSDLEATTTTSSQLGIKEEEIVAEAVILPPDGGWGWVIVVASFLSNAVVDGLIFTVGQGFLPIWEKELAENKASVAAWCVSLLAGCYLLVGPIVSAVANIYGCRLTAILGAIIAAVGFVLSMFAKNIWFLYFSFGLLGGIGLGFVYLPSIVIVSHYFEKKRALATGIAVCGSGIGTFIFAPFISLLLSTFTWQNTMLIMTAVVLHCIIFAVFYRPLAASKQQITKVNEKLQEYEEIKERKATANGTQLPTSMVHEPSPLSAPEESVEEKRRLLSDDVEFERFERRPKDRDPAEPELEPQRRQRTLSTGQRIFRSTMDLSVHRKQASVSDRLPPTGDDLTTTVSKRSVALLNRPLSRMDIFYAGSVQKLPQFKSQPDVRHFLASTLSIPGAAAEAEKMAVGATAVISAEIPAGESNEKDVKNTLKSVLDYSLFASPTFILLALSGFFTLTGFFVPFIYLPKMARNFGHSQDRATFLVSALGITNIVARILCGYVSDRPNVDPLFINNVALIFAGVATAIVPHCQAYGLLLLYCVIFGMGTACFASLRSIICVALLGLEKLTNAYGLLLLFMGMASLIGSPMAGFLFDLTNTFNLSFYVMGALVAFSGLIGFALPAVNRWEQARNQRRESETASDGAKPLQDNKPSIVVYEPPGSVTNVPETVREEDEDNNGTVGSNGNAVHSRL